MAGASAKSSSPPNGRIKPDWVEVDDRQEGTRKRACQHGHRARFTTAAALVSELIEALDDKHLLRFQRQVASYELLIVDELGFAPLSKVTPTPWSRNSWS